MINTSKSTGESNNIKISSGLKQTINLKLISRIYSGFNFENGTLIRKVFRTYPHPFAIDPSKQSWNDEFPDYSPTYFTDKSVRKNFDKLGEELLDQDDMADLNLKSRFSYEGKIRIDKNGFPLNPLGRMGISGRGILWKWGPNHAADPIIILKKSDGTKQILLIERADANGVRAFPGGMCDPGEESKLTAFRELKEETGVDVSDIKDFDNRLKIVFGGIVDDPRNTDNAWIESRGVVIEIDESEIPGGFVFNKADSEVKRVKLVNIESLLNKNGKINKSLFYASHGHILQKYLDTL